MLDTGEIAVFLSLDVGKGPPPRPNSEPKIRAVFNKLTAKFGTVLVTVDQPASIGALPLAVPGTPAAPPVSVRSWGDEQGQE